MTSNVITLGDKQIDLIKSLGQGTYGSVYLIRYGEGLKAIKIISTGKDEGIKSLLEIDVMGKLIHPNLVRLRGVLVGIDLIVKVGLVMDLASTDLQRLMIDPMLTTKERIKILHDVGKGLKFLHDSNYIHLDLKPMNVLIFGTGTGKDRIAKITDFGISLLLENNHEKYYPAELVTVTHRAPEIFKGNYTYTRKSDIWSLGIIFLEVLSGGKQIYKTYTKTNVLKTIKTLFNPRAIDKTLNKYLVNLDLNTKKYAIPLIKTMLSFNPYERPDINTILSNPLFDSNSNNTNNNNYDDGIVVYNRPLRPRQCDVIYYFGFDYMFRKALKLPIRLETFFLASDIYQRALAYAHELSGDFKKDWPNVALLALTSLFMAIKMIEIFKPDMQKISGEGITYDDIVKTEGALVQLFGGVIYPKNLFTETNGHKSLLKVFEALRNCNLYYRVDLEEWKRMNTTNPEPYYNKYIPFIDFAKDTQYYKRMALGGKYIEDMYKSDSK
jgi:serine/threonine protein kinase